LVACRPCGTEPRVTAMLGVAEDEARCAGADGYSRVYEQLVGAM
jgi:hypothetical protein